MDSQGPGEQSIVISALQTGETQAGRLEVTRNRAGS